jgi:hypothetical protein
MVPRKDKFMRRYYYITRKVNMLKSNIKYKTCNIILFYCDYKTEINYYIPFSKRIVGNNNIVYLFKNKSIQNIGLNEKIFSSELISLKKNLLIDYGIDLKINKKILLCGDSTFNTISTNFIYIHNMIDKTLILNPKLNIHNINMFNILLKPYISSVYIVYTSEYNIDKKDTKKISISDNNIFFTKNISMSDIYKTNINSNIIQLDEFVNIIYHMIYNLNAFTVLINNINGR